MIPVQTDTFEGPLDLLLKLIREEEMPISQVSLATIAEAYLLRIREMEGRSAEEMARFLVIAAQLLYIKSHSLLPSEEQEEFEEETEELTSRLSLLAIYQDAARILQKCYAGEQRMFSPRFTPPLEPCFSPAGFYLDRAHALFSSVLKDLAKERIVLEEETIEASITVEDRVEYITSLLSSHESVSFSLLLADAKTRTDVIVTFLSALELLKQQSVHVTQSEHFGDMVIASRSS